MNIDLSKYPVARSVEFYTGNIIQYTYETADLYTESTSVDKGNNEWGTPLDGSNVYAVAKNVFTYGVTKRDTFTKLSGEDKKVDCNIRLGFSIGDYTAIQLHNEMFRETNTPYTYSTRNCVSQSVLRLANSIDINKFCFNVRVCIADISNSFTIPNSSVIPLNVFLNDSTYDTLRLTGRDGTKFLVYLALSTLWYAANDSQKWKRYVNGARNYYVYPLMQFNNGVSSIIQYGIPGLIIAGARSSSNYQTSILNQNNYNAVNGTLYSHNYQYGNQTISGQRQQFLSSYYDDGSTVYGDTAYSYFSGLDYCFNVENWYDVFNSSDRMFNNYGYIVDESDRKVYFSLSNSSPETMNFFKYFTLEELLKKVASLGCYFTGLENSSLSQREFLVNNDVFLGKMYEDGHTDGTYTSGAENANQIQYNFTDMTDSPATALDTSKPPEPATGDEITTAKHNNENSMPVLSGIRTVSGDAFSTFYHLSMYHIVELGHLISQMPQTFWDALGTATDYKQSNILDYLVSLKWYPLNLVDSSDTVTSDIQFGFNGVAKITFTAAGTSYKVGNINRIYDMGSITIPYRADFQSFLDLEPYTSVSAYLPYIGTVSLQANDVVGYTITCTYIVDLTTGMCTGILDNGTDTIYIGTGKIGVDISVSGNDILTQSEKMASSVLGAASGAISNTLSLGASVASVNVAGAASAMTSAVTDLASSAIGIANSKRGIPETVGSASGFGGGYTHQAPYIRVQRPAVSIPGKYGHDVGYVCNRSYTIGTLSGYTVCSSPDLSGIPATSAELDMIRTLLISGFYA